MTMEKFRFGLFGFLILLQLCSGQGNNQQSIVINDSTVKKDDCFYTWEACPLSSISKDCDFFMYFNTTELNQTKLYMKIDLFSHCNFTGKLCNLYCESGTSSAVFFQRIAENVHPITFSQSSYEVDVPESTGTDAVLLELTSNMTVRKDCYYNDVSPVFAIKTHEDLFQVKGTKPPGLYLKERLDYEKNTIYNVTVEVILYDQTNTTEFIINVIDVDDMDPVFLNDSYSLHIMENDTDHVNTWLWTTPAIAAEDRDKGQGRQNLTFSISSGSNDLIAHLEPLGKGNFQINSITGQIRVTKVLFWKKDELNMYHLTIQATQDNDPNRYATSFLNVYVNDTNNHRPIFTNNPYKAVIDEHARVGSHVTQVHAEDGDEGPFAITSYKIIGSVRLFAIDSQTGIITVANSTGLDREAFPNITLEVQAIDVNANETGDTTFVEITLHDINDHTPNFTKGSYIFHVSSSDTAQVHANDDDIGRNGRVSYELFMEPSTPHVTINKDNGTITFINIREDLTFSVSACDNPIITSSRRCSIANVKVFLNGTVAGTSVKNMSVAENSPIDTIVGSLDIDDTTFNVVQQDIPFIIGNDHLVRTTRVLDRENTSTYSFTVAVTGKIISNITVNVAISDVNDNPPVFNSSEYVFGLPSGSTPVGSVLATDVDLGENGNISYSFQNSFAANKYFAIDSRSGEITLSGVNIPLYQSSFQLGVLASDNGVPKMNSFCSVYISRVTIKGNYTVSIGTPLKEDVLRSRIPTLQREIGNIVNLTITAKVPTAVHKRATTPQEFGATLQISAMYKNGTRVPANDLQRVVLVHLSDIEALWTQEANVHKDNDNHSSVSEIALIVVAGVMLLGTLIALIVLTVKWRQFKSQEKVLRLNESLTRRSSLYESQEIKVRMDDETSDYNGSLNTQDLETYENGHRPLGETNAFENPVYKRDDFDETKVKAQAINEALLSLNSLSDRLDEEDPLAPKPDYEKTEESGLKNNPDLDEYVNSVWTETPGSTDLNTYDSVDSAKNTNSNPYENIEFDDDFPSTSGFAGLKIDGKMITSSGEGHEDDVFIGEEDNNDARYESENEDIPEDEPDVDYHLKQVRFANRVVNADTNIAEELKPDKSELEKETDKKVASTYDDNDDDDDDKVFQINTDSNNESDNDADFQVDNADASIRMDEEINSPLDFLKNDDNNTETLEDSGTFVFGGEETTAL